MTTKTPVLFCIYPNNRGFGYVLIEDPQKLIDYGIVTIRPLCNGRILQRIEKMLKYYKAHLVITQEYNCPHARYGKRNKKLIDGIVELAQRNNLEVHRYTRIQIRDVFEQFDARTKHEVSQTIAKWLPEIAYRAPKMRKTWQPEDYNMGLFDALSLAYAHYYLKN